MIEFNTSGLYKGKVPEYDEHKFPCGVYHCRNYTYKPHKYDDGNWYMLDTYFNNNAIKVTEENVGDFKLVFDFKDVRRIPDGAELEYEKEDVYYAATDSGGYSCGRLYWVKKDAKKSSRKLIEKKLKEIESHKRSIDWLENDIKRINDGEYNLK